MKQCILFLTLLWLSLLNSTVQAQETWSYTFAQTDSLKDTTTQFTVNDVTWNLSWDKEKKAQHYVNWGNKRGWQFGASSGGKLLPQTLSTTHFKGTIRKIYLEAATNPKSDFGVVYVSVDGKYYQCNGCDSIILVNDSTKSKYTFNGEEAGELKILMKNVVFLKHISITYQTDPAIAIADDNTVTITTSSTGTIYYTTDNSEVIVDGKLSSSAIRYTDEGFRISKATTVKAVVVEDDGNVGEPVAKKLNYRGTLTLPYYENFEDGLGNFIYETTASENSSKQSPQWTICENDDEATTYGEARRYASVTGKDGSSTFYTGTARLITSFIDLKGFEKAKLNFIQSGYNFDSGKQADQCQLYYRTSETGTWQNIQIPKMFECSPDFKQCNSGDIVILDKAAPSQQQTTLDTDSLVQLSFLFTNSKTSGSDYGTWNLHKLAVTGTKYGETENYETITLKNDGYATYVTQNDIDWSKTIETNNATSDNTAEIHGYKVIEFDNSTVVLQEFGTGIDEVESITPAETPIVVKALKGKHNLTIAQSEGKVAAVKGNLLHPSYGNVTASDMQKLYVIQTVKGNKGWYKLGTQTIPHRKAYLNSIDAKAKVSYLKSNPAKGIYISMTETDSTTGIRDVESSSSRHNDNHFYNLNGMRVDNPTKGVYILNKRKVIIK